MNTSTARTKIGKVDNEINNLSKFTIGLMVVLAGVMIILKDN